MKIRRRKHCHCEPVNVGGHVTKHDSDCPRNYDNLHTAEQIAMMRQVIMTWDAQNQVDSADSRQVTVERMARGITARAVELGIEKP